MKKDNLNNLKYMHAGRQERPKQPCYFVPDGYTESRTMLSLICWNNDLSDLGKAVICIEMKGLPLSR